MTDKITYRNFNLPNTIYQVNTEPNNLQKLIKEIEERNKVIIDLQNKLKNFKKIKKPNFENASLDIFNRNYKFIDQKFEEDEILSKYICAMRQLPIRYPVSYITSNGKKLTYERRYIIEWLQNNKTDPLTREKVSEKNYFEDLEIRKIIEERLKKLK